jgi:predicted Fe-Mo cluster-binding NifX family protein
MKICITSQGRTLDSAVDPRFGRCPFFIIADTETLAIEAHENKAGREGGGAGIQAGQFASEQGVQAVLTGNVGPNAFQTLSAARIEVVSGVSGTVREAVERYKNGELKPVGAATVDSHHGMTGES